jgi:hypothetical protein
MPGSDRENTATHAQRSGIERLCHEAGTPRKSG